MAPFARVIIVAAACALPLGGCVNFDPVDWMAGDWFQNKKPLPGQRKDLFPEGVPGVSKGVPPDLMRGNQAAALQDEPPPRQAILPDEPKPKAKPKAKPKPKVVKQEVEPERRPTAVTVRPQPQQQAQQPQSQWPDPPAQQRQQPQSTQWPDPPGPGSSRPVGGGGGGGVAWPDPPAPR